MEIVFFDYETAGISPEHPNIQLAAIAVDDLWNELETFERKIYFDESKADPKALEINHYDRDTWIHEGHAEAVVLAEFDAFLNRHKSITMLSKAKQVNYQVARLAGHNAASFDMPRLRKMYAERFFPAHPLVLDSLQLALWYFRGKPQPANYQLSTLLDTLGIPCPDAHDALADVRGSIALAKRLATF